MITVKNYNENGDLINKIIKNNPGLKSISERYNNIAPLYAQSSKVSNVIDMYIAKLNELSSKIENKREPIVSPKEAKTQVSRKSRKLSRKSQNVKKDDSAKKATKTKGKKAEKPDVQKERYGTFHKKLPIEVSYIRRYMVFDGKQVSKNDIVALLTKIEADNAKGLFSVKDGNFGKEVKHIHGELTKIVGGNNGSSFVFSLDKKDKELLKKFTFILEQNKVDTNVQFIARFMNIYKKNDKVNAQKLLKQIENAQKSGKIQSSDDLSQNIKQISLALKAFINGKSLEIPKTELKGLAGIEECAMCLPKSNVQGLGSLPIIPFATTTAAIVAANEIKEEIHKTLIQKSNPEIVSSEALVNMNFKTMNIGEPYRSFMGDPSENFKMLIFGPPKHGKSTFAIMLANYLAKHHGNVLYVGIEEKFGYTLSEKIERLQAVHPALDIAENVPSNLDKYQFIFVDSISRAKMSAEDVRNLFNKYPNKAFALVTHVTKDGQHRGSMELQHDVDIIVEVVEGVAKQSGRFATSGQMKVMDWLDDKPQTEEAII